ncbi:large subunit ribosomal protein L7A [Clostridium tetanomorphum]|uniref:50S ribosomal protein L7ae-like protein n=1 Tax=Clostridium tetanomorphum TaxID=1553 RepID=A0A923EF39_CLOTT|nr:ribosomal L7Ae/L30e/S12e/Gadd45 family protein [Clostridium tetanomorphum]KAJ49844.1 ribosomal protein L7Ae-like protein [Clostridium tetanomorphum DSM 665]MBC2400128.1 50S ribosomal protein L7ae-like protein [Clostridium tetanomorphum]MBP1863777.1 large subunit ribosomal protein L7A [Clostridium tetanomorphum]NRS86353.1 large subunit ribosomal protein L7A [Clostridium tetanomorphum]NRZ95617.1 large subunit ribosomal protein L7A [Clostridium tetanomorphum]
MIDRLNGKKVVGFKQSLKVIKNGSGSTVYIAKDADKKIFDQLKSAAEENSLEIVYIETMKELGKLCGIDVGAATAVILND